MPRVLSDLLSLPNVPALPSSPQVGDVCVSGGIEYICLSAGVWTPRTTVAAPVWQTPTLVSGYTYSLPAAVSSYMILLDQAYVLEPGTDYSISGQQFTVTSSLARAMIDGGSALRAVLLGSTPYSLPSAYYLDIPPASPNSLNLEFGSTSGLTEWDPGNRYSLNIIDEGLSIRTDSAPGGVEWGGAYFALPTSNTWTMFAKCGIVTAIPETMSDLRTVNWGIALLQDTTNSSQLVTLANGWTGADSANGRNTHVFCTLWSSYTTFSTEYGAVYYGAHDEMATYFRITRNGSTYTFWFSRTGAYWSPLYSGTLPWTPAVGAVVVCNGFNRAGLGAAGRFYHVRFVESSSFDIAYPGRRI